MERMLRVGICIVGAWIAAMALSLVTYFAYWPSRWNVKTPDSYLWVGFLGALFTALLPLLTLGVMSIRRVPPPAMSVTISAGWLLAICFVRMSKPWRYFGDFPAWMLYRDFLHPLPVALASGLIFGLLARRLVGPNNSFKPKPLRGSA
jgi:hypothetical protein